MTNMKMFIFSFLLILNVAQSRSAFAQSAPAGGAAAAGGSLIGASSYKTEISLSGGFFSFSSASSQVSIAPAIYYKPLRVDLLQVGLEYSYQSTSHRGGSASNTAILGGVVLNLGALSSAFFCSMGMALKGGSGGPGEDSETIDPNGLGYHFICGKRLPIGSSPNLVFKPSIGVITGGTGGMVFRPLAISYLF